MTVLNNCTVCGNSASTAGGGLASDGEAAPSVLAATNCIVYGNQAPSGSNYLAGFATELTMSYCCTTPLPAGGTNDFTNNPVFVNAATGDYQLQSNSPCINAGTAAALGTDLDGNPRVVGGFVDLGAYEYQGASPVPGFPSLQANYTGVSTGIVVGFTGQVAGHAAEPSGPSVTERPSAINCRPWRTVGPCRGIIRWHCGPTTPATPTV